MDDEAEPESQTVTVLFFSVLREKTGTAEQTISLPRSARGRDLLDVLADRYPALQEHRSSIRLAVNQEYVSRDTDLQDGDEVALITPVSGG